MPLGIGKGRFLLSEHGVSFAGEALPCYLERKGLLLTVPDGRGPAADPTTIKMIRGFYPAIEAPVNTLFEITVGSQLHISDEIEWEEPREYFAGDDTFVDTLLAGRYLSFRIESDGLVNWRLLNYFVDFTVVGGF